VVDVSTVHVAVDDILTSDALRWGVAALVTCGAVLFVHIQYRWSRRVSCLSEGGWAGPKKGEGLSGLHSVRPFFGRTRIRHMIAGTAIGDAFGAGIEFRDSGWIRDRRNVDFSRYVNRRLGLSARNFFPGMYTDDTEMTVGCMNALLEYSSNLDRLTGDELVRHWTLEYAASRTHYLWTRLNWLLFGVGRCGHGSMEAYYKGKKTLEEIRKGQAGRKFPGNAGPMRCLPFAFVRSPEIRRALVVENANATHPHPKERAACFAVVEAAVFLLREGASFREVLSHVIALLEAQQSLAEFREEETLEYLKAVDRLPDYHREGGAEGQLFDFDLETLCGPQPIAWISQLVGSPVRGLDSSAMHTAGCVLYLIKWTRGSFDLLRASVSIGGDVDSVASIGLGLLGLARGLEIAESVSEARVTGGIPKWVLKDLEAFEKLMRIADRFAGMFVQDRQM